MSSRNKVSQYNPVSDNTRREFLKKIGLGASASALLSLIPTLSVSGAECPTAKRLILFYTGDGSGGYDWRPTGNGLNMQLCDVHQSLNPHRADLTYLIGMENTRGTQHGDGHIQAAASMWTASGSTDPNGIAGVDPKTVVDPDSGGRGYYAYTRSIDQEIANRVSCFGDTARKSYHMGVNIGYERTRTRVFQQGDRVAMHVESNINGILTDLFPSNIPTNPNTMLGYREKIFDSILFELESIKTRAPVADRPKFDQHISALQTTQQRLINELPPANNSCQQPIIDTGNWNNLEHDRQLKIMIPLAVNALSCDRTRIMCFQLNHTQQQANDSLELRIAGDNGYPGFNGYYHGLEHGQRTYDVDRCYASMFALLLQKLKEVPEGNGTMLDNSLVVWSRDLVSRKDNFPGMPNQNDDHGSNPICTILAGSAGGQIQTGRVINVGSEPNAKLFVSMGRLMGIENFNSFGDLRPNSGALTQFFS